MAPFDRSYTTNSYQSSTLSRL